MDQIQISSGPHRAEPAVADPFSVYQRLRVAKIALVAMMIGLALTDPYRVVPHQRDQANAARALVRNSLAELVLGAVVVALVVLFGLIGPQARSRYGL